MVERLSRDPTWEVRAAVAHSPSCPQTALSRLSQDTATYVRLCVAGNPSSPLPIIEQLMRDQQPDVALSAAKTLTYQTTNGRCGSSPANPGRFGLLPGFGTRKA